MGDFNRGILRCIDLFLGGAELSRNGGRITLEQVAELNRNGWPNNFGISGRIQSEYSKEQEIFKIYLQNLFPRSVKIIIKLCGIFSLHMFCPSSLSNCMTI